MGVVDKEVLKDIDDDEKGNEDVDGTINVVGIADSVANGTTARDEIADGIANGTLCGLTNGTFDGVVVNDGCSELSAGLLLIDGISEGVLDVCCRRSLQIIILVST